MDIKWQGLSLTLPGVADFFALQRLFAAIDERGAPETYFLSATAGCFRGERESAPAGSAADVCLRSGREDVAGELPAS